LPVVTVAVPTLAGDECVVDAVRSLAGQTAPDVEIIVIDNSGERRVQRLDFVRDHARIIDNDRNLGFGAAINQAIRASGAEFVAVLNDDAVADPNWLEQMLAVIRGRYEIGMCAPQIRLAGDGRLDSAGMRLGADGSSKQRGHLEDPARYAKPAHVLFPSGCAALYRRAMLDEIGLFDESFFLYCEDTDLGLRARWGMWECMYVPGAIVEHRYSHTSGPASAAKAWFVERNRLRVAMRNLPAPMLAAAPLHSAARYFWHAVYLTTGSGKGSEFREAGGSVLRLPWIVLRANLDLLWNLPRLLRERRQIRRTARLSSKQFSRLLRSHRISARQVAAL
jgi:GT2 family glycosyltransferase